MQCRDNIKPDCITFEEKDEDLHHALSVMNEIGCRYWISNGTLLALIRDGKPFSWDHDIDLCLFETDFTSITAMQIDNVMRRGGFEKSYETPNSIQYKRPIGKKIDLNLVKKVCEQNCECKIVQTWRFLHHGENFLKKCIVFILAKFFTTDVNKLPRLSLYLLYKFRIYKIMTYENTETAIGSCTTIDYFDVRCSVPANISLALEELYGKNWRTPETRKYWFSFAKEMAFDHFE